jgi:hypothetical protein
VGWIGFDFDGTLAEWGEGTSNPGDVCRIGKPILPMVLRLRQHVTQGDEVKIFTARVGPATDQECWVNSRQRCPTLWDWQEWQTQMIHDWMVEHVGYTLPITATKDFHMYLLYDDRCKQVVSNTGAVVEERYDHVVTLVERLREQLIDLGGLIADPTSGQAKHRTRTHPDFEALNAEVIGESSDPKEPA